VEGDGGAGGGGSQAAGAPSGGAGVMSVAGQSTGGGESGATGISGSAGAGGAGVAAGAGTGTGASGGLNGVAGTAGESGGGTAGVALVGVFVAQGHQGRITRSCDDGLTFPYNHSADDAFVCFSDADHDCDHSAVAGRGLAFGSGSFVATWGWGHPGTVQRSTDGKVFSDVITETPTFADIAFGNGVFVAGGNPTPISSDGSSWSMGGKLSFDFNYRGIEFVPTAGGMFIVTGESGDQRAISWSRDGKTWTAASERPDLCGQELRGVAGSDAVMIVVSGQGHVCRSTDGDTWTYATVTDRFTSPPLWTGNEFWVYSGAKLFKSSDGQAWTSQDIEPKNIAIGPLARSPQGTLVAANDGWQVWYDKQQFFRSTDGVHWDVLPKTAFTGSHPIYFMSFGYVPASAGCGLP
jgi:hypothetical protein